MYHSLFGEQTLFRLEFIKVLRKDSLVVVRNCWDFFLCFESGQKFVILYF
jgi:hypothetical protein